MIPKELLRRESDTLDTSPSVDSMEVAHTIAGYVAKKLKARFKVLNAENLTEVDTDALAGNNSLLLCQEKGYVSKKLKGRFKCDEC